VFIHIGGDTMVRTSDIVGIFDIEVKNSPNTAKFVELARKKETVKMAEVGAIKSFIVTDQKFYFSPISSLTLKRRAQFVEQSFKLDEA